MPEVRGNLYGVDSPLPFLYEFCRLNSVYQACIDSILTMSHLASLGLP